MITHMMARAVCLLTLFVTCVSLSLDGKDIEPFRFSKIDLDAVLFVRAKATIRGKAFGPFVHSFSNSTLELALVDARSGEIVGYAQILKWGDYFRTHTEQSYQDKLLDEFREMRLGTTSSKKK